MVPTTTTSQQTRSMEMLLILEKAKLQHWADYLENATSNDIWTVNWYIKTPSMDGGKARVPTQITKDKWGCNFLSRTNNSDEAEALAKSFFPKKPVTSSVPENYVYPQPLSDPPKVALEEIHRHVKKLSPCKASGPDEIPNIFLQKTIDIIKTYLHILFRDIPREPKDLKTDTGSVIFFLSHWRVTPPKNEYIRLKMVIPEKTHHILKFIRCLQTCGGHQWV